MGESYLMVNGKRVDLTPEQQEALGVKPAVREVKRAAKVGEWVKVVRVVSPAYYKVGDIRQVVAVGKNWVDINVNAQDGFKPCLYHSEYIVLENYVSSEDKPAEPDPMAVFYCYKSYKPGEWLTEGKTYTLDADGFITYDDGDCFKHNSENDLRKNGASFLSPYLATESKRPAKAGDDVLIKQKRGCGDYENGDILKISKPWRGFSEPYYKEEAGCYLESDEYVVLDHYHPEPKEKHPLERVEAYGGYAYIDADGLLRQVKDGHNRSDDSVFDIANYAADTEAGRALLTQRAMHETLSRLLWRFAELNGGVPKRGEECTTIRWSKYGSSFSKYNAGQSIDILSPRFKTFDIAQQALVEVVQPYLAAHPDFKW